MSGTVLRLGRLRALCLHAGGRAPGARSPSITIVNAPVRLLATRSRGWRDLGVHVAGGGARASDARLPFDGTAYAVNPSARRTAAARPRCRAGC